VSGALIAEHLTWQEFHAAARRGVPVIVPVGTLEEHGPHLPLATDTIITENMCRAVAERAGALLMPTLRYGVNFKFATWPGSCGLGHETLTRAALEIGECLAEQGFRRLAFFTGHDENYEPLVIACRMLNRRHGLRPLIVEWAKIAKTVLGQVKESRHEMHAGEAETSLMLHLAPELVRADRCLREWPGTAADAVADDLHRQADEATFIEDIGPDRSRSGCCGDATLGRRDKGETIFRAVVDNTARLLEELKEGQTQP